MSDDLESKIINDEEVREQDELNPYRAPEVNASLSSIRPMVRSWPWVILCLAIGASSILYRVLVLGQREQSALMFIGLPLVLAILLTLTPRPRSATGMIMKGMGWRYCSLGFC